MNYIVFDLEWNQPASQEAVITEPIYLSGEIIEIGAVKLNETFQPVDEVCLFVKPVYYAKIHNKVASLTGIHNRDLAEKGVPFSEAYAKFITWCGDQYAFMTWSMSDIPILIDNMILHDLDISDFPECYDIQRIFGREIVRGETRYSLETALSLLCEQGDKAHDALHDARNAVKVCDHLELDQYLDEYTSKVFAERPNGVAYDSRGQLLQDPELQQFDCPWCGETVKCEPWVQHNANTFLAYGMCTEGDEFLLQLSIEHNERQSFFAKRIIFEMSDDLWDTYMDKKEALGL